MGDEIGKNGNQKIILGSYMCLGQANDLTDNSQYSDKRSKMSIEQNTSSNNQKNNLQRKNSQNEPKQESHIIQKNQDFEKLNSKQNSVTSSNLSQSQRSKQNYDKTTQAMSKAAPSNINNSEIEERAHENKKPLKRKPAVTKPPNPKSDITKSKEDCDENIPNDD